MQRQETDSADDGGVGVSSAQYQLFHEYDRAQEKAQVAGSCSVDELDATGTDDVSLDSSPVRTAETAEESNKDRKKKKDRKADEEIKTLQLENENLKQQNSLRTTLGHVLIAFVGVQLIVSDFLVAGYVVDRSGGSEHVMLAWLSASVVEIIGIIGVVARSLFPIRSQNTDSKIKKSKKSPRIWTPKDE